MDANKYFKGNNLKNAERKHKFGYAKKCAIWAENFYFKFCTLHNSLFLELSKRPILR